MTADAPWRAPITRSSLAPGPVGSIFSSCPALTKGAMVSGSALNAVVVTTTSATRPTSQSSPVLKQNVLVGARVVVLRDARDDLGDLVGNARPHRIDECLAHDRDDDVIVENVGVQLVEH